MSGIVPGNAHPVTVDVEDSDAWNDSTFGVRGAENADADLLTWSPRQTDRFWYRYDDRRAGCAPQKAQIDGANRRALRLMRKFWWHYFEFSMFLLQLPIELSVLKPAFGLTGAAAHAVGHGRAGARVRLKVSSD